MAKEKCEDLITDVEIYQAKLKVRYSDFKNKEIGWNVDLKRQGNNESKIRNVISQINIRKRVEKIKESLLAVICLT